MPGFSINRKLDAIAFSDSATFPTTRLSGNLNIRRIISFFRLDDGRWAPDCSFTVSKGTRVRLHRLRGESHLALFYAPSEAIAQKLT
jgi:hypothetical protein